MAKLVLVRCIVVNVFVAVVVIIGNEKVETTETANDKSMHRVEKTFIVLARRRFNLVMSTRKKRRIVTTNQINTKISSCLIATTATIYSSTVLFVSLCRRMFREFGCRPTPRTLFFSLLLFFASSLGRLLLQLQRGPHMLTRHQPKK